MNLSRVLLLRSFRLAMVVALAMAVRANHQKSAGDGRAVDLAEVTEYLTDAVRFSSTATPAGSVGVENSLGETIGYAICSMPDSRTILGYSGPVDMLIVCDPSWRVLGVKIRSSEDTTRYVSQVSAHRAFMSTWVGMSAKSASRVTVGSGGFHAVTGATATSTAAARSIAQALGKLSGQPPPAIKLTWTMRDVCLLAIVGSAFYLTFSKAKGRRILRRLCQGSFVAYFVFVAGDLLSLKLILGWSGAGVEWRHSMGIVALLGMALLLPWSSGKAVYCVQVCPHGILQEWASRVLPLRLRLPVSSRADRVLEHLPSLLLYGGVAVVVARVRVDLSDLEPFDAYNSLKVGLTSASLVIAVVGLLLSFVVPKAYCKYGCPTGRLLETVRTHSNERSLRATDYFALGACLVIWATWIARP